MRSWGFHVRFSNELKDELCRTPCGVTLEMFRRGAYERLGEGAGEGRSVNGEGLRPSNEIES